MFTGLVQESSRVVKLTRTETSSGGARLVVESCQPHFFSQPLGASIAVNGVCLTLVESVLASSKESVLLSFEVSSETLARSNLGFLTDASFVHLELPLNLGSALGGHLVSGHVDGVCEVASAEEVGDYLSLVLRLTGDARKKVAPFLVEKGSIALDGVSLTVNSVVDQGASTEFEIMLIPHTLSLTWPDGLTPGRKINVEADLLAKHFVRFKTFQSVESVPAQNVESHVSFV